MTHARSSALLETPDQTRTKRGKPAATRRRASQATVLLEPLPTLLPKAAPTNLAHGPTDDEIRTRAYQIYLARAGRPGTPEGDWLQAERELRGDPTR